MLRKRKINIETDVIRTIFFTFFIFLLKTFYSNVIAKVKLLVFWGVFSYNFS